MSDGPGLYRLYKDGEYEDFTLDERTEKLTQAGWFDNPTDALAVDAVVADATPEKSKRVRRTQEQIAADEAAKNGQTESSVGSPVESTVTV